MIIEKLYVSRIVRFDMVLDESNHAIEMSVIIDLLMEVIHNLLLEVYVAWHGV
jgi:hypothetical protein